MSDVVRDVKARKVLVKTAFSPNRGSDGLVKFDPAENRTKQEFRDKASIHSIIDQFKRTGQLPQVREGMFGDFGQPPTLLGAMSVIANAQTYFEELPSGLRFRFDNSFSKFHDFVSDPRNLSALQEMGLAPKKVVAPSPAPVPAPVDKGGKGKGKKVVEEPDEE